MNIQLELFDTGLPPPKVTPQVTAVLMEKTRLNLLSDPLPQPEEVLNIVVVEDNTEIAGGRFVGETFGFLLVVNYRGAGSWRCNCSNCGGFHNVDHQELNSGFSKRCRPNAIMQNMKPAKRKIIDYFSQLPGFLAKSSRTAEFSRRAGRNSSRLKLDSLPRLFWEGYRVGDLTILQDLGSIPGNPQLQAPGYWLCLCDCKKLSVVEETLLLGDIASCCGCKRRSASKRRSA
jgi:hypothetical protein